MRTRFGRRGGHRGLVRGLLALSLAALVLPAPSAMADSPDPVEATMVGSSVENNDGSHTLTLSGQWQWNRACGQRVVGWEIDWNDPDQDGNVVGTVGGVTVDVGAAAANGFNPADNKVDQTGLGNCVPGNPYNTGSWGPISHTYAPSATGADVCVVTYDIVEGMIGGTGNHSDVAGGPNHNTDNSIEKNFLPLEEACNTQRFEFKPPTVSVDKTNDAGGNGIFNDSEEAATEGAAVPFRAVITNTSNFETAITEITDAFGNQTDDVCANLIGDVLAPGGSATCNFTLNGYAPPAGQSLTNTVTATLARTADPSKTATASDTSTVTTKVALPSITVDIDKTNDANQDGTFTDSETAKREGQDVDFEAVITNTSAVPVIITELTDAYLNVGLDICPGLIGDILDPGESVTCSFTVADYAPPAGEELENTASVVVVQASDQDNSGAKSTTSTVTCCLEADITVDIDKVNDANQDGTFHDFETANSEGQDVDFEAEITNTSAVPVIITELTDAYLNVDLDICAGLIGDTLDPGDSVTCSFTVEDYAPPAGEELENTASVVVVQASAQDNSGANSNTSTVTCCTQVQGQVILDVDKTNDADDDGDFSDREEAPEEDASVEFRAVIRNASSFPVVLTAITDSFRNVVLDDVCDDLIGMTLAASGDPGDSATCRFTLDDYAPAANTSLENTIRAEANEVGAEDNSGVGADTSRVTSPEVLRQQQRRLAFTGGLELPFLALALLFLMTGAHGLLLGRRKQEEQA